MVREKTDNGLSSCGSDTLESNLEESLLKSQPQYSKRKHKMEQGTRNQVESKIGQGINGYNFNNVRARTSKTSKIWIGAIFFVMNLIRCIKDLLFSFLEETL